MPRVKAREKQKESVNLDITRICTEFLDRPRARGKGGERERERARETSEREREQASERKEEREV